MFSKNPKKKKILDLSLYFGVRNTSLVSLFYNFSAFFTLNFSEVSFNFLTGETLSL